ncbi:hypothetical protein AURANDRAFT_67346 [Aureococcus anophagefferens]|uniref:Uncharacterized protein n=1 Tax=Aureococcus anophagefferens TaxID=44056 RepID=F0YKU5_AURAN|nr:hypothetical protein AURANDRAFT_67346 [Aureococcus anophagefferens]EGB04300.1 hypothetical protein AURANDRAFT_67346 [Aureococcus anophagefferens]|eukprot:XP_009041010.1 hypothetical protein AURANDRAFT_67346 [Aureococcus anophagefferens]
MPDLKQHKRVTCYSTATLSLRPGEERVIKVKFSAKIPEGQWVDDQYDCAIKGEWADNPHTDDPGNHRNGMVLVGRSRTDIGGFMWEGDGTRYGQTYVKNTHQNLPIRIERGQELGETNVISGVVTVFYSGIGGFDKGLQRAWEKHGAAFKVVLAIDNCELSNEIHQNTFPGVTVVNHILGKSFKTTMDLISEYVPREQWSSMYWHASPSCIEGSTANMQKRNVKEFVKLTLWTLSLMRQCRPGMWTLEQIPVIARYVMLETPYAEVLNMREFTAQTSDRKRLIASKRDLKLQKLSAEEYKEKFISPKRMLMEAYDLIDKEIELIRNGHNYVRSAEEPAYTITGNPIQYGPQGPDMKPVKTPELLRMMDIEEGDFQFPDDLNATRMLKLCCQCIPPSFSEEMTVAVLNTWHDSNKKNIHNHFEDIFHGFGVESEIFAGDPVAMRTGWDELRDNVVPDIAMVMDQDTWRIGRVAEHDHEKKRKLVCLAYNMAVAWYDEDAVCKPDGRLNTRHMTKEDLAKASVKAHTMQTEYAQEPLNMSVIDLPDICKDVRPRPDRNREDPKYDNIDRPAIVFDPRRRVFERYSLEEIEQKFLPYDYDTAGEFIYEVKPSEGTDISPEGCLIPPNTKGISTSSAWREQVDHLLLDKIMNNRKLMAKLGGMSLPEDGGAANDGAPEGVSFLMGISHMTGVPFSIMHDPTIADLWMALRDMFLTINQGRVKGNKLTNIKISIASRDGKTRSSAKDLGTAVMTSGGPNVDSHVLVSEPERRVDTWGRLCEINRRTGITHELGAGVRWTITFYSDFRNRFSQNTAVQLMDSVTDGTLWGANQHPQKDTEAEGAAANSTETTAEAEVWPPWKNADRDERGLPLPDQPRDLGVDDKWRVKPATDQELIDTMKRIGVTDNPVLGDSMKQHFKEMIAYCWDRWLWTDVVAVVDDVAMGSSDEEHHLRLVTDVVCTLAAKGFSVKAEKMQLFIKLGEMDTNGLRSSGAEFMVTWGESLQHGAVGETNLTEAFSNETLSNEGVEIQILKGVAMPTISENDDESKETDSSQDQETLKEIDQAKRARIALQASDTITDKQYQDAAVDDPFFLKIQKQLNASDPSKKAKAQKRWLIDDGILWQREDGKKELKSRQYPSRFETEIILAKHGRRCTKITTWENAELMMLLERIKSNFDCEMSPFHHFRRSFQLGDGSGLGLVTAAVHHDRAGISLTQATCTYNVGCYTGGELNHYQAAADVYGVVVCLVTSRGARHLPRRAARAAGGAAAGRAAHSERAAAAVAGVSGIRRGGRPRRRDLVLPWRIPPQRAFTKRGGDIQRYVVRGYVKGEEIEVKHNAVGPAVARRHRRDFCANPVIDRGIALRQNLGLPVPDTASTLIHGLTPSVSYHFTVSCVAEIDDEIRESPPSLMSKPLEIPAIDDEDWNTGEIIEKVLSYSSSSRTHHRTHGDGHAQVLVPGDAPRANDAEIADAHGRLSWSGKSFCMNSRTGAEVAKMSTMSFLNWSLLRPSGIKVCRMSYFVVSTKTARASPTVDISDASKGGDAAHRYQLGGVTHFLDFKHRSEALGRGAHGAKCAKLYAKAYYATTEDDLERAIDAINDDTFAKQRIFENGWSAENQFPLRVELGRLKTSSCVESANHSKRGRRG